MDAHVFRRVGRILADTLSRARLERIHEPFPGIAALSFYSAGKKQCLLFRAHRSVPLLFLTGRSPFPNPAFPPAYIMRIRKHAEGRILGEARINWVARQMAFRLPSIEGLPEQWLFLDCRNGPSIRARLDPDFEAEPLWPQPADLAGSGGAGRPPSGAMAEPWERFQVLTPQLRRALETMEEPDAAALLADLEDGSGNLFWYGVGDTPQALSAWPLPFSPPTWEKETPATPEAVFPQLEAMCLPLLLAEARTLDEAPGRKRDKAALRKRKKLAEKLAEEKKRLERMLLLGDEARLLQANLWQLPATGKPGEVSLPSDPENPAQGKKTVRLNPLLTITENMELFFKKSAKAARGLAMLEKRMEFLRETPPPPPAGQRAGNPERAPQKGRGKKTGFSPALIQEFVSSDGFILWRGRSAEGNRELLKLANPFDLWLHAEDGPSAHLIIRRDHAAGEVPERTLEEAAALVGLKSWRKNDPGISAMVALVKHVRPVKGAGPGTVRVQEQIRTVPARIDPALEEKLKKAEKT